MISSNEIFLLDSNVFIEPKNRFYPFDIFPGYWRFLLEELGGERVRSITHVYDELMGHEDDLSNWARQLGRNRFEDCAGDEEVFMRYLEISSYVRSLEGNGICGKRRSAIEDFLRDGAADPWLVAHASIYGETLVTMEASRIHKQTKVSLVDVCSHFEVKCSEIVPFLRRSKARFELKRPE